MAETIVVRQASFGQTITLKTRIDITGYSDLKFLFWRPVGNEIHVTASCDDPTTGVVYWTTTSGFFNVLGVWKVLARIKFDDDSLLYTGPVWINVVEKFDN